QSGARPADQRVPGHFPSSRRDLPAGSREYRLGRAFRARSPRERATRRSRTRGPSRPERAHRPCTWKGGGGMKHYPRPEPGDQPSLLYPAYGSTLRRVPARPLIQLPHTLSELTGPLYGHNPIGETDNDLTRQHADEPLGERIIVAGRVLDEDGRPI